MYDVVLLLGDSQETVYSGTLAECKGFIMRQRYWMSYAIAKGRRWVTYTLP